MLAVLVEGGGADHAQLAAGQHRLDHVAGVHGALGGAGADDGVQLVDERDDLALGVGDLLQHGLQPLLELAAVLGPGHHRRQVEGDEPLVLQALGHVAVDDAPGQALDDGRLADAGLADQHRVVLGAPGQHLDRAADLVVAADDRVELALGGHGREVAPVALEGLVLLLGVLARDAVRPPHLAQRAQQLLAGDAEAVGHGQQEVLDRQVVVVQLLAVGIGGVEQRGGVTAEAGLGAAVGLGQAADGLVGPVAQHERGQAEPLDDGQHDRVVLAEQGGQQVVGRRPRGWRWRAACSMAADTACWVFCVHLFGSSAMPSAYLVCRKVEC